MIVLAPGGLRHDWPQRLAARIMLFLMYSPAGSRRVPNFNIYSDSSMSWQGHFAKLAVAHGLTYTKSLARSYVEWCDENPNGLGCASTKKMEQFLDMNTGMSLRKVVGAKAAASAQAASSAPVAVGLPQNLKVKKKIYSRGNKLVIEGTDMVSMLQASASPVLGEQLFFQIFGLLQGFLSGTRVEWLARGFEKWKLESLVFHYQPSCPTSSAGMLIFAWDNDPTDPPVPASLAGIKELYSYESNMSTASWQPATFKCTLHPSTSSLFTNAGADARLWSPGSIQVVLGGLPAANLALGTLWCSYTIVFESPSELASGPDDTNFYTFKKSTATGFATGSSLISQLEAAGATVLNSGNLISLGAAGTFGYRCFLLSPGLWMIDVLLLNQTTALATGLSTTFGAYQGSGVVGRDGDVIDVAMPANNGSALYARKWIGVPVGAIAYWWPEVTGAAPTMSTCSLRVRNCTIGSTTQVPSAADVDSYAF